MAITRRQFVTRLGALAAAAGFSQAEVSQDRRGVRGQSMPTELRRNTAASRGSSGSTVLSAPAVRRRFSAFSRTPAASRSTATGMHHGCTHSVSRRRLDCTSSRAPARRSRVALRVDRTTSTACPTLVNIADVVIDVIDLQYHETVMGMGGDLAAKWLKDFMYVDRRPTARDSVRPRRRGCAPGQAPTAARGTTAATPARPVVLDRHGRLDATGTASSIDMPEIVADARRAEQLRARSSPSASAPPTAATLAASRRSLPADARLRRHACRRPAPRASTTSSIALTARRRRCQARSSTSPVARRTRGGSF